MVQIPLFWGGLSLTCWFVGGQGLGQKLDNEPIDWSMLEVGMWERSENDKVMRLWAWKIKLTKDHFEHCVVSTDG